MARWKAYAGSKLCNVLYAAELSKRYGAGGVVGLAVRPGPVRTRIVRHSLLMRLLFAVAYPLLTPVEEVRSRFLAADTAAVAGSHETIRETSPPMA